MLTQLAEALRRLEDLCSRPETPSEDRGRRGYLALCFLIIAPVLAAYGFLDLKHGRLMEASVALALAAVMAAIPVLMSRVHRVWGIFRSTILLTAVLGLYMTAVGGGDGLVFVWFYTTPLIVFFLFGGREGAVWVIAIFAVLLVLFFGEIGTYIYDPLVGFRFVVTYGIIAGLGYGLEMSRRRHYDRLLAEKVSLEKALADVKILSGLLPICASCKAVRDDRGYWSRIETYVQQHSDARFLRGLCPRCRAAAPAARTEAEIHASAS